MLKADRIEPWMLVDGDVGEVSQKVVDNDAEAKKVRAWVEDAEHSTIVQKRKFIGLTSWREDVGKEQVTFTWYVGGGKYVTWARIKTGGANNKFRCRRDRITIENYVTGAGWQVQEWEKVSNFAPAAGSYTEEDVT